MTAPLHAVASVIGWLLDLPGPAFLVLYALAFITAVMWWLLLTYSPLGGPRRVVAARCMGPYDIACMNGGTGHAIRTALVVLLHRGRLTFDYGLFGTESPPTPGTEDESPAPLGLHPIEAAILDTLNASDTALTRRQIERAAAPVARPILEDSIARGYTLPPGRRLLITVIGTSPGWALVALGVCKVGVAIDRDQPYHILIYALVINLVFTLALSVQRPSRAGRSLRRKLSKEHAALKATINNGGYFSAEDLAMGYALYGVGVLKGGLKWTRTAVLSKPTRWLLDFKGGRSGLGGACAGCGA